MSRAELAHGWHTGGEAYPEPGVWTEPQLPRTGGHQRAGQGCTRLGLTGRRERGRADGRGRSRGPSHLQLGEQGPAWQKPEQQGGTHLLSYPRGGLSRSGWRHMGGTGWGRALWRCSCCTRSTDKYRTLVAMARGLALCSSMKTPPTFALLL